MNANILSLDTTAEFGSIALRGEEILLHAPDGFGGVIFQRIEQLLQRLNVRLEDIDGFAAGAGPGSFTGVRIGLAAIKGLAEATNRPAIGVSNLEALARFGTDDFRVPVIDARRGEVYAAAYDANGRPVMDEIVCRFPALLDQLPAGAVQFISQDFRPFAPALSGTRFAGAPVVEAPRGIARMIGRIAEERLANGDAGEPAAIDANYVRRSDAELLFKPW